MMKRGGLATSLPNSKTQKHMNILFISPGYIPTDNNGATWMAYDFADYLKERHNIRVVTDRAVAGAHEGVEIVPLNYGNLKQHMQWADKIVTHLHLIPKIHNICRAMNLGNPYVIIHGVVNPDLLKARAKFFNIIYNSEYTRNHLKYPQPSIICRPPLIAKRYTSKKRKPQYITLVNCHQQKGGDILAELAALMPEQQFMGVIGGYGAEHQIRSTLPNVKYVENTIDMRPIYAETKILIQPSQYESYGKAVCEAMACGIPVVVTATDGLIESTGSAGVFAERTAYDFKEKIEMVLADYDSFSKKATARAAELVEQTETDLINFEKFLTDGDT